MAGEPPGPLVGVGRAADVYAVGADRVLRRTRFPGYDSAYEAGIMRHLAGYGYPVPEVFDADGTDLVMERLHGRDMLADLGKRPWLARKHGRVLADLHNALHQIPAPPGIRQLFGPGDSVMHLDLHPANVMLTARGPVVIDWPNASAGPAGCDIAHCRGNLLRLDRRQLDESCQSLLPRNRDHHLVAPHVVARQKLLEGTVD